MQLFPTAGVVFRLQVKPHQQAVRERLSANAHPIYIPIGAEEDFQGMIDLASMQALVYDPKDPHGMSFETTEIPSEVVWMTSSMVAAPQRTSPNP